MQADVFESAHQATANCSSSMDNKINKHTEWLTSDENHTNVIPLCSDEEIKCEIFNLKNKKAAGLDGIKPIVLKKMPDIFFTTITTIFNWCLLNGYFPNHFKKAKVIPVLKSGKDPKMANSYRPISILSMLDKVFEKIIHKRLLDYCDLKNIINKEQFGFKKEHSTIHQLKRVINMILANKRRKRSTGAVFLDIEKAFDSVWHNGLIYKMNKFTFPVYLQKIIKSFLSERTFVVEVGDHVSSVRKIPAGVPQGSVLSPLLYSIFTSDFKIPSKHSVAFYADDSAFISSGKLSNTIVKNMEKAIISAQKYFRKWKIKINAAKTQAIIFPFNKSPKRVPTISLSVDGMEIQIQDSVKYLGIIFDKKLIFKKHILETCNKAVKCGRALYPLLNRKSKLNIKNKLLLYKMCIRPILSYGCQIWSSRVAKTNLKCLQIIQNKNLKTIFKLNRRYSTALLHSNSKELMINELFLNLTNRFKEKCNSSSIEILRNLHS